MVRLTASASALQMLPSSPTSRPNGPIRPEFARNALDAARHLGHPSVREVRDEEPAVVADGEVVDAGLDLGQRLPGAGGDVDAGEPARAALAREQAPFGVELHRGGGGEVGDAPIERRGVEVVAPDLAGQHLREPQRAVGAHGERVGHGEVVGEHHRLALAGGVELEQAAAGTELVGEEPAAVVADRHPVDARQVVTQGAVAAVGTPRRHRGVHRLRGEERAVHAEGAVVGHVDAVAERRERLVGPAVHVDGRDLRAEHLRHHQPVPGTPHDAVGAPQRGRTRDGPQRPSLGDLGLTAAVRLPSTRHDRVLADAGPGGVPPRPQQGAGPGVGELPVADDLLAVDEHVGEAVSLAVEPPGAAGQVVAGVGGPGADRGRGR